MLPPNLLITRHAESIWNEAKRRARAGDQSLLQALSRVAPGHGWLTELGHAQVEATRTWYAGQDITKMIARVYYSPFVRAMQTCVGLNVPCPSLREEPLLAERSMGVLEALSDEDRRELYARDVQHQHSDPMYWRPPNGESMLDCSLRADRVLGTLHRETCEHDAVLLISHGHTMRALAMRIERMTENQFVAWFNSTKPCDQILNCETWWYTRTNPGTGEVKHFMTHKRVIRPTEVPVYDSGWREIVRPAQTYDDLRASIRHTLAAYQ